MSEGFLQAGATVDGTPGGNGIRRTKMGDGVGTARSEEKATRRRKHGSMWEEMKRRN